MTIKDENPELPKGPRGRDVMGNKQEYKYNQRPDRRYSNNPGNGCMGLLIVIASSLVFLIVLLVKFVTP